MYLNYLPSNLAQPAVNQTMYDCVPNQHSNYQAASNMTNKHV